VPRPQPVHGAPVRQLVTAAAPAVAAATSSSASPVAGPVSASVALPTAAATPVREMEPEIPANRTRRRRSTAAG
jgi:hypothetical protein